MQLKLPIENALRIDFSSKGEMEEDFEFYTRKLVRFGMSIVFGFNVAFVLRY